MVTIQPARGVGDDWRALADRDMGMKRDLILCQHRTRVAQRLLGLLPVVSVAVAFAYEAGDVAGKRRLHVEQVNFQLVVLHVVLHDVAYRLLRVARAVDGNEYANHGVSSFGRCDSDRAVQTFTRELRQARVDARLELSMIDDESGPQHAGDDG